MDTIPGMDILGGYPLWISTLPGPGCTMTLAALACDGDALDGNVLSDMLRTLC